MRSLLPLLLLLLPGAPAPAQVLVEKGPPVPAPPSPRLGGESLASEYIHFLPASEGGADRLQTAVTRFEKGGRVVDLVGVVHLGDPDYYRDLNARLRGYDAVLYEMVGGPHPPESGGAPSGAAGEMGSVRQLQQLAKGFLGLEFQLDGIDYAAENFVHADVGFAELEQLMQSRNETLLTLFTRAMTLAEDGGRLSGLPSEAEAEAMMKRLLEAVLTGNSGELKRTVAPLLSEAETFITQIEGEDGTVIVSERNRVVMEKLAAVQAEKTRGTWAIFYGAGHMPDLERRLLADGYAKGETVWLDAWTIQPGTGPVTGTTPADLLIRLLSENPEVISSLQEMGTALEQIGGALKSLAPPEAPVR